MKTVIITGASSGIGRSAAIQCARRGMGVILTYNSNPAAVDAVVRVIEQAGGSAAALKLDVGEVASFAAFRDAVADVLGRWGGDRFDALVNNAGHGLYSPLASVTEAQFDELMAVHLKGPLFLTQTLLPLLADGGQVVNVTSATTRVATAGFGHYAALKGGLEVLTRYMAKEFANRGVRANSIAPGAVRTNLGGGLNEEIEAVLASQTALGRVGEPDDLGKVIASLLSDDNAWINAQSVEVAGGYMI